MPAHRRRSARAATSWRSPPRPRAWWSRARRSGRRRADRGCRISASRCSRRGRAELLGDVAVVLAALVGVADQQRDRRAGGDALVHAGEDLDLVGLAPLRGVPRAPGGAALEVGCGNPRARSRCPAGSRRSRSRSPGRGFAEGGDARSRRCWTMCRSVFMGTGRVRTVRRCECARRSASRAFGQLARWPGRVVMAIRSAHSTTKMPICPTLNSTQANGISGSSSTSAARSRPLRRSAGRPRSDARRVAQDAQHRDPGRRRRRAGPAPARGRTRAAGRRSRRA
jgi:hypothetical protein